MHAHARLANSMEGMCADLQTWYSQLSLHFVNCTICLAVFFYICQLSQYKTDFDDSAVAISDLVLMGGWAVARGVTAADGQNVDVKATSVAIQNEQNNPDKKEKKA